MEANGLPGRMFSSMGGATAMLGLEMPLHNRQPPTTAATTPTVSFSGHADPHPQTQLSMKQSYPYAPQPHKPPQSHQSSAASDDDEPGGSANDDCSDPKRKVSPWQRMKWTDTMVKLLIMAVFYIGDEAGGTATTTSSDGPDTKKHKSSSGASNCGAHAHGGLLQKKGKWKSVSQAMMEKGYCVSPQQCEDKFNDLNKRYKRVNDILGRGTACRVVENQSLLETMNLSPKMKEEVRKLLNSKHLFFREMCAYHNSCGHGTGSASAATHQHSPEPATEHQNLHLNNAQRCGGDAHHAAMAAAPSQMAHRYDHDEDEGDDEDEDEEEEDYEDDDHQGHEEDEHWERKRARVAAPATASAQLKGEMMGVLGDGSKTAWEKQQWLMVRQIQLEEAGLKYQVDAFEIEKQRLKWAKYSNKKEMEMERMKIENERRRLENQRMLLLLRQKELEVFDYSQHKQEGSNPSPVVG